MILFLNTEYRRRKFQDRKFLMKGDIDSLRKNTPS